MESGIASLKACRSVVLWTDSLAMTAGEFLKAERLEEGAEWTS
jgi:hypothetical protein